MPASAANSVSGDALNKIIKQTFDKVNTTDGLLQLALRPVPPDDTVAKNIRGRAYFHLAQKAEHAEEAEIIKPHIAEFLADFDKDKQDDWKRERIARLLLKLNAAGDRLPEMVFAVLKEIDLAQPYPQWRQAREMEASGWLKQLSSHPRQATTIVYGLTMLLHKKFYQSARVVEDALQVIDGYKASRDAAQTDALVQAYGKLRRIWTQQKESEAKFANSLTVWDGATEADVATAIQRFEQSLCTYRVPGNAKNWAYIFVPDGSSLNGTGAPITITCAR